MNDLETRDLLEQAVSGNWDAGLVLSDHLQEKGDPRGELITLEHTLKNPNGNSAQIKRRRNKLAKDVKKELKTKFPDIKVLDHWCGFPTDIVVSPENYDAFNQGIDASSNIKVRFARKYEVITGNTYANGVYNLRSVLDKEKNQEHPHFKVEKTSIYRPLTSEEVIEARVIDYWTLKNSDGKKRTEKERLRLFYDWLDSCTGIVYQKGTTKFKIDLECEKLIRIGEDFNEPFLRINYDKFPGEELDSKDGIYDRDLTFQEFLEHSSHAATIPDKTLRKAYGEIVYAKRDNKPSLQFYVLQNTNEDQLRSWYVSDLGSRSSVSGNFSLGSNGRFPAVAQETP